MEPEIGVVYKCFYMSLEEWFYFKYLGNDNWGMGYAVNTANPMMSFTLAQQSEHVFCKTENLGDIQEVDFIFIPASVIPKVQPQRKPARCIN